MFELLLIIYLLPVLIIGMLLLKLVFWLLRISIRLAVWLVKKTVILIWKLIVLVFAIVIGREIMPWIRPDKLKERVCRNARCTFFLFIIIQTCSFSLSCDLLKISLIYVFPVSKNSSYKLIKQSNQPVHTFFCQFCTHLFYIEGNG